MEFLPLDFWRLKLINRYDNIKSDWLEIPFLSGDSFFINDRKSMFVMVCADVMCIFWVATITVIHALQSPQLDLQKGTCCKASATDEIIQFCLNCMLEPSAIRFFLKGVTKGWDYFLCSANRQHELPKHHTSAGAVGMIQSTSSQV